MEHLFHGAIVAIGLYLARKAAALVSGVRRVEFTLAQILFLNTMQAQRMGFFAKEAA